MQITLMLNSHAISYSMADSRLTEMPTALHQRCNLSSLVRSSGLLPRSDHAVDEDIAVIA